MYFFRINWAITGRTTSRHKGLTTSRRTAMGQQLLRIFWSASIARLTVWGRPSEVYFAPVDLKDWFCRRMFEKDFKTLCTACKILRHGAQPVPEKLSHGVLAKQHTHSVQRYPIFVAEQFQCQMCRPTNRTMPHPFAKCSRASRYAARRNPRPLWPRDELPCHHPWPQVPTLSTLMIFLVSFTTIATLLYY